MITSMTKAECKAFERMAEKILTEVLGEGRPDHGDTLTWTMPHENGCTVEIELFRDSFRPGRTYRRSWLACRLRVPADWLKDGYTRPRGELPWPGMFTYPSGKANFSPYGDLAAQERVLIHHLMTLAPRDSREWHAFSNMPFWTA